MTSALSHWPGLGLSPLAGLAEVHRVTSEAVLSQLSLISWLHGAVWILEPNQGVKEEKSEYCTSSVMGNVHHWVYPLRIDSSIKNDIEYGLC